MKIKLPSFHTRTLVITSVVLTIIALLLMVWSVLVQTPLPVMLAMTVGQGIGTFALGIYLYAVVRDLRRRIKT